MYNIIVWCFFFVIFPCNYCGEEKLFAIDIHEHVNGQSQHLAVCNVTERNIIIKKGESIGFNVTSEQSIDTGNCTLRNDNSQLTTKLTKQNGIGGVKENIFKFNTTILSGNWTCKFYYLYQPGSKVKPVVQFDDGFNYTVSICDSVTISINESWYCDDTCIISTASIVSLLSLTIFLLLGVVIYYRRKSKALHNLETLSAMPRESNDRARYSKPPLKKPLITVESTERDSCIYEALDALQLQVPAKTMEPADDTPSSSTSDINIIKETKKKNKTKEKKNKKENKKMSLPVMKASKIEGEVKIRAFSFGKPKAKRKADKKDKRTTIERIRERPPLPLPEAEIASSSDEYEDMGQTPYIPSTPEHTKHEFNKVPKNKLPMPMKTQNTLTKAAPPPLTPKKLMNSEPTPAVTPKPFVPTVKPNVNTVSELESVLKKKGISSTGRSTSPSRPKGTLPKPKLPPEPRPTESVAIPRPKGTLPKPSLPTPPGSTKPAKPVPQTPLKPTMPKLPLPSPAATLKPTKSSPMGAPVPPPISTLPRQNPKPAENPAPIATPRPAKRQPMDAPVPPPISTLPRPILAAPVEEPDYETDDNGWEGEDWTYEPLPTYNIYSK